MKEQIQELEWRINIQREEEAWVDPDPDLIPSEEPLMIFWSTTE
jgi:hypothetical protein